MTRNNGAAFRFNYSMKNLFWATQKIYFCLWIKFYKFMLKTKNSAFKKLLQFKN